MSRSRVVLDQRVSIYSKGTAESLDVLSERDDLSAGILKKQAEISPKYFYDSLGSRLFEAICELDEYYLTRTETWIMKLFQSEISIATGSGMSMIDLGAGNCAKAATLFDVLKPREYLAIDVSASFLETAVQRLKIEHPLLPIRHYEMDFSDGLILPPDITGANKKLFFYPGSSIGNFTPVYAEKFLRQLRSACNINGKPDGALLIGVDLIKDARRLEAAYDDSLGVTASFNANILRNINKILCSNFDPRLWRHTARFNAREARIEMHLAAKRDLAIVWPGGSRNFVRDETIHTESSYKYTVEKFLKLLTTSGFGNPRCWSDEGSSFLVCYAEAI